MLSLEHCDVYWHGFAYLDGIDAGAPSIRRFAEEAAWNLGKAAANLKGVYFIALRDKRMQRSFAFVDNSGLHHAYYSPRCAGTSFLDIASCEKLSTHDLDPEAVAEFLQFGCIYDGRTFFSRIRKIDADAIVESLSDGSTATLKKGLPDIAEQPRRNFQDLLKSLAESISCENVSLDLTGGIDSRLLAAAFSYLGMPFEVAASGKADIEDIEIAQQVANTLGREFFLTAHEPSQTNWDDLFLRTDGLFDLAKADRPLQLQRERCERGITLTISGAGGELFKDFWWLQDFPFYLKRKPNLERLYKLRFAPNTPNLEMLAQPYYAAAERTRDRILKAMSEYSVASNTRTYDRIYYGFKMREFAGRFLTNTLSVLPAHAPYLDREAVAIGHNLSRPQRFFNRFHRSLITRCSSQVAAIETTEGGMTASAEPFLLASDLLKYAADRLSRLKTKVNQRRGRQAKASAAPDSPQLGDILSALAHKRKTVQRLQDYGILDKKASLSSSGTFSVGALMALDMLIERMQSGSRASLHLQSPASQAV